MRYRILTSHLPFVSVQRQNGEGCASGSRFLNFSRFAPTHTSSCRPLARHHYHTACSSGSDAAASNIPEKAGNGPELDTAGNTANTEEDNSVLHGIKRWWRRIQSPELRQKLVSLGPAAVLAYGLFDGFTYTIAFAIAFLGYEASTGLNPTQNVADLIKICILMWGGNNVTRPFRLAGAAALAPFMDRLMDRLQKRLRLPNKAFAFGLIVGLVAVICFSIIGSLFLSRWVRG